MIPGVREALAARYREWPSEDLLRAVTVEPHEYTAEALELIREELSRRNYSTSQRQELLEAVTNESNEEARNLTGIKGFLALLVFGIAASSILALARAGSYVLQDGSLRVPWFFILVVACQGCFGLVVCALLVSRNPHAPRYAATWFLLVMTLDVATSLYSYVYTGEVGVAYPLSTLAAGAVWLSYLSASKRVKATYKSEDVGHDASTPNPEPASEG